MSSDGRTKVALFFASAGRVNLLCRFFITGLNLFANSNPEFAFILHGVFDFTPDGMRAELLLRKFLVNMDFQAHYVENSDDYMKLFRVYPVPGSLYQELLYAYADEFIGDSADIVGMLDDDALQRLPLTRGTFLRDGRLRAVGVSRKMASKSMTMIFGNHTWSGMAAFPYFVWRRDLLRYREFIRRITGFQVVDVMALFSVWGKLFHFFTSFLRYVLAERMEYYYFESETAIRIWEHAKYSSHTTEKLLSDGLMHTLACGYGGALSINGTAATVRKCGARAGQSIPLSPAMTVGDLEQAICGGECRNKSVRTECAGQEVTPLCTSAGSSVAKGCRCLHLQPGLSVQSLPVGAAIGGSFIVTPLPITGFDRFTFSNFESNVLMLPTKPNWKRDAVAEFERFVQNCTLLSPQFTFSCLSGFSIEKFEKRCLAGQKWNITAIPKEHHGTKRKLDVKANITLPSKRVDLFRLHRRTHNYTLRAWYDEHKATMLK